MKEVVKFPENSPVEVTLQCETGTHVAGLYGDQVMYSLTGDRVMYVPPYVEQRLQDWPSGRAPGALQAANQRRQPQPDRVER